MRDTLCNEDYLKKKIILNENYIRKKLNHININNPSIADK